MKLNHAILHILDFASCENTFAHEEMDPSNKRAKNYALKHAGKALGSIDAKHGSFAPDSHFATRMRSYFRNESNFIELSIEISKFIGTELEHMEKPVPTDVLVIEFEDDTDSHVREMSESEANDAYRSRGKRYFGVFLLESKPAYVHDMGRGETGEANEIAYNRSVLPSPSQKIASWALVESQTLSVTFCDKPRTIAGEECSLIPDKLLQCSSEASSREALDAVTELVEAVAQEYGENPAISLAKAKSYASSAKNAEIGDAQDSTNEEDECPFDGGIVLDVEKLGARVFDGNPAARERFEQIAVAHELPERIPLQKKAVERVAKSHRIRTDTGIEITFPAEYGSNPDFMTFTAEADGTYSISLKNIAHIENR